MRKHVRPAILGVILLTLLTGCIFPLGLFAVGRLLFHDQADGKSVDPRRDCCRLPTDRPRFHSATVFHPRPSAAGAGYDAVSSGGTNFGPSNPKLIEDIRRLAEEYRRNNELPSDAIVPIDAVTRSGSGLDPHISPANAALQVARVARARALSEDAVRRLVSEHTQGRQLGFLGNPRVSVLDLNLTLDQAAPFTAR